MDTIHQLSVFQSLYGQDRYVDRGPRLSTIDR